MEHKTKIKNLVVHIILIIFSLIMLVPFAWMILTALKTNQEAISVNPFYILPHNGWHWENFATVWKSYNFIILYKNTLLLIFFRVVCACLTATMAGYAFGRLKFPGKTFMFTLPFPDLHHPSVPDGFQDGNAEHDIRSCVPRTCNSIRYLPAQDRL